MASKPTSLESPAGTQCRTEVLDMKQKDSMSERGVRISRYAHHAGMKLQNVLEGQHCTGWPAEAVPLSHFQKFALAVPHALLHRTECPAQIPRDTDHLELLI